MSFDPLPKQRDPPVDLQLVGTNIPAASEGQPRLGCDAHQLSEYEYVVSWKKPTSSSRGEREHDGQPRSSTFGALGAVR